jgi:hypothetical protein
MDALPNIKQFIDENALMSAADLHDLGYFVTFLRTVRDQKDAKAWADLNVSETEYVSNSYAFVFQHEEDAMLFKLAWG